MGQYTLDGSKKLEQEIDKQLSEITEELLTLINPKDLVAFVLGGGYGRGEGGVLIEGDKESLYNDYDLFVITKNISHKKKKIYQDRMIQIHRKFTPKYGIDVDVGPIQTVKSISKAPHWMMWYELKYGLKVIYGNKNIKDYFPDYTKTKMPIMEAYRLLLNRGVGLLLCKEHFDTFEESQESREFVLRNIRKAQLAMGDAYLILIDKFHYSYKKRREIYESLADDETVKKLNLYKNYITASNFKFHPNKANLTKNNYLEEYQEVLHDYEVLYNFLFNNEIKNELNLEMYNNKIDNVCKQELQNECMLKNMYKNIRDNGIGILRKNFYKLNPRFVLFQVLPFFLFDKKTIDIFHYLDLNENNKNLKNAYKKFIKSWELHN